MEKTINKLKTILLIVGFVISFNNSNSQGSTPIYINNGAFGNDPCVNYLSVNGCTFKTKTIVKKLTPLANGCQPSAYLTIKEMWCNGKLKMATLVSSGIQTPPNEPGCEYSAASAELHSAIFGQYLQNQLLDDYPELSTIILATGSACKATVSFSTPAFTARGNVPVICDSVWVPAGSSTLWGTTFSWPDHWKYTYCPVENVTNYTVPASNFSFELPCDAMSCCYGEAVLDNTGKVIGFTANPSGMPSCNNIVLITPAQVRDFFKETFDVQGGGENNITNIVIGGCQEKCNFDLTGDYHTFKSTKEKSNNADYSFTITSIDKSILNIKTSISPSYIQVHDMNGRLIINRPYTTNILDMNKYPKGIYILRAVWDINHSYSQKLSLE